MRIICCSASVRSWHFSSVAAAQRNARNWRTSEHVTRHFSLLHFGLLQACRRRGDRPIARRRRRRPLPHRIEEFAEHALLNSTSCPAVLSISTWSGGSLKRV